MYRPRIIPVLLLRDNGLVKSTKFKNYKYIGDPINAVRIFNELYADEIVFLDIEATKKGKLIDLQLVKEIGEEANCPQTFGDNRVFNTPIQEAFIIGSTLLDPRQR